MGYLGICAIMKWEQPWLKEWIDYHHALGVEQFILFANEIGDRWEQTQCILGPYSASGLVRLQQVERDGQQLAVYNCVLGSYRDSFRWIAFIDLDEFIYPVRSNSIPDMLEEFKDVDALAVNWLCFGSSGHRTRPASTLRAFTRRSKPEWGTNRHVKSIVNPTKATHFLSDPHLTNALSVNEERRPVTTPFSDYSGDIVRINHYPIKSWQDFIEVRCKRGSAFGDVTAFGMDYFDAFDRNEVFDDAIVRRFSGKCNMPQTIIAPSFPDDVRGWMTQPEGELLRECARGRRVLEVGSFCGKSTICLAQSAASVMSVDIHTGDKHTGPADTLLEFRENLRRFNVAEVVTIVQGDFQSVAPFLASGRFDLLHLDAAHSYEDVKADITACQRLMTPRATWMFHDYENDGVWGVRRAVEEFFAGRATSRRCVGTLLAVTLI